MVEAYPLAWPDGWPRTEASKRALSLPGGRGNQTWDKVVSHLTAELRLLAAGQVVLSTDQPIRRDGMPYAAKRLIDDPGAAVYFRLGDRDLVMAQDRYRELLDNIRSLALAIEGLRQMRRHGGAYMMERAFRGFEALPAPETRPRWRDVLDLPAGIPTVEDIERAYRRRAKHLHPDRGGSDEAMSELTAALEEARAAVAGV